MAPTSDPAVGPPVAPPVPTHSQHPHHPHHLPHPHYPVGVPHWTVVVAIAVGALFVLSALTNAAVTVVAPGAYAALGDWSGAPEPLNRLWHAALGDHARAWLPVLGVVFEALVGLLCLARERRRRALGLSGATAFHVVLLAMGMWPVALPMVAVLGWAAVTTWRAPGPAALRPDGHST